MMRRWPLKKTVGMSSVSASGGHPDGVADPEQKQNCSEQVAYLASLLHFSCVGPAWFSAGEFLPVAQCCV